MPVSPTATGPSTSLDVGAARGMGRGRALALLKDHGWDATSFQTLEPGFRYWFDGADACVAYVDTGRSWMAAGAPIAPAARAGDVARSFVAAARAARRRAAFFATEHAFVERTPGLRALAIGQQPVWRPAAWRRTVARAASLRAQLRRAAAKGVRVRDVGPRELDQGGALRARVEALIARWLGGHVLPPMGFLVQVDAFSHLEERRCFVAERDGRLVGFLAAVPVYARGGWLFEDLVRDAAAPNGTNELLFDAAMRAVADAGSDYATLGLAPLAGRVPWWLRFAGRGARASGLYDFRGLATWKSKLRPASWTPVFLSYGAEQGALRTVADALSAFAHGHLWTFGARAVYRGAAAGARAGRA
jgi:phosphatidylglycerol lysyltransferase